MRRMERVRMTNMKKLKNQYVNDESLDCIFINVVKRKIEWKRGLR